MNRLVSRNLLCNLIMLLLVLIGSSSLAQTSLTSTVPGDALRWETNALRLAISVTEPSDVSLEVYSPAFDPDDYRSDDELGDERYDGGAGDLSAQFSLSQNGQVIAESSFGIAPHATHTLFSGRLEPGEYILDSSFAGLAKNTFIYTLNAPGASVFVEVLETQLYNIERGDYQTAFTLDVGENEVPVVVEFYDGDGAAELVGRMKLPNGTYAPLAISEDRSWLGVTLSEAGRYSFEFYVPEAAYQYSNTIGMRVNKRLELRGDTLVAVTSEPTFTVKKTVAQTEVMPGDTVNYTLSVTNTGGALGTATLKDILPEFLDGESVLETFELPAGATRTFDISAVVLDGAPDLISNEATLTSGRDVLTAQALVNVIQPEPRDPAAFSIEKTVTPQIAQSGDTVTYTLTVTNTGGSVGRVALADTLPRGLEGNFETQSLRLEPGETRTFELSAVVRENAPDTLLNFTTIVSSEGRTFTRQRAQAELRLERSDAQASFVLSKQADRSQAGPGDSVRYTLMVGNVGEAAGAVTLADELPSGLIGENLSETVELAPGETRSFILDTIVAPDAPELVVNKARIGTGEDEIVAVTYLRVTGETAVTPPQNPAPLEVERFSRITLTYQAGDVLSCELGEFSPGESKTVAVTYAGNPTGLAFERSLNVDGLSVSVREATPVASGSEYLVRLENSTSERVRNVVLDEPLPLGTELVAASHLCQNAAPNAQRLLVSHVLPAGSAFVPGSVLADGRATGDPYQDAEGRLYFVLPYQTSGTLSYRVSHAAGLEPVTEPALTLETKSRELFLVGDVSFDTLPAAAVSPVQPIDGIGIEVRPLNAVADALTPLRFELRALSEDGTPSEADFITIASSLEFAAEDAAPELSGYQVALENGVGILMLEPQTSSTILSLSLAFDDDGDLDFDVTETLEVFIVSERSGLYQYGVSATLTTAAGLAVEGEARGYAELPLGAGQLQVAVDAGVNEDGFDTERGLSDDLNPLERFPLTGAGSEASPALRSDDGVAARYEQGNFSTGYYAAPLSVPGVEGLPRATALRAELSQPEGVSAEGFVGLLPSPTRSVELTPDGTRIYSLGETVTPQSERLVLVSVVGETPLTRLEDYSISYTTGLITLAAPLQRLDETFNPIFLRVDYAPEDAPRDTLAYGAGVRYQSGEFSFGVGAALVEDIQVGADARYDGEDLSAGLSYRVDFASDAEDDSPNQRVSLVANGTQGDVEFGVNLTYDDALENSVRGLGRVAYRVFPGGRVAVVHEGSVLSNRTGVQFEQSLGDFVIGAGLDYAWEQASLGGASLVGYSAERFSTQLRHSQPFDTSKRSRSTLQAGYQLSENLDANAVLAYEWGNGVEGSFGLSQRLGAANLTLDYRLPTLSGAGNRARFGVSAPFKVTEDLSVNASAGYTVSLADGDDEASFGAAARYRIPTLSATLGVEVSLPEASETKITLRAGAAGQLAKDSTLSFDATAQLAPEFQGSFTASYALKAGGLNLLTYHRLKRVAEETLLEGELAPTYVFSPQFQLRPDVAYRINFNDADANTYQASLFGRYTFDVTFGSQADPIPYEEPFQPTFGLGAGAVYRIQPGTGASRLALGLEGSVQVVDPIWITAGYLFDDDFNGLTASTRGGFYLRLDLLGAGQF